jgi:hypothetical protein
MHTIVPKIFHMIFHMNYHVKVKHNNWNYDQIIIKLWNPTNK